MKGNAESKLVFEIAAESDMDVDETLVALWDLGLDFILNPNDRIPRKCMPSVRAALGINVPNQRSLIGQARILGISETEVRRKLTELGFDVGQSTKMPKGAASRLRRSLYQPPVPVRSELGVNGSYELPVIGKRRNEIEYLELVEVVSIYEQLIEYFKGQADPISPAGIRDQNLLSSAVERPRIGIDGILKYPTIEMATAAFVHSITLNHSFANGNKRTALVSGLVMMYKNGLACTASETEALKLVVRIATHSLTAGRLSDMEVAEIATWLFHNSRPFKSGEKSIKFHRLRRILNGFDCKLTHPAKGNRVNIVRTVRTQRFLGRSRKLSTQIYYRNEGFDVDPNTVTKIRADLELDDLHGCDSLAFYEEEDLVDEIIVQYQLTLRRLARL